MFSLPQNLPAKDVTRLFRTLSDDTRFRLLRLLCREELTVNELAEITQLAQPRISNHLKILREENLIVERRRGSWRHYRVDLEELDETARSLWPSLQSAWSDEHQFGGDDKRLGEVLAQRADRDTGGTFFDELANRWDAIRESLFGDALGREILRTFLPPDLVVADVGTGTGYVLQLFGRRAKKLIAVDNSEAMLDIAREKAAAAGLDNVEFRLAEAGAEALQPAEVDVLTLIQVLHHLEKPGDALKTLSAAIKPGGLLIVSDFLEHQEGWLRTELQHRWSGFSHEKITAWLHAAGLELKAWEVLPGRHYTNPEGHRVYVPDGFTAVATKKR